LPSEALKKQVLRFAQDDNIAGIERAFSAYRLHRPGAPPRGPQRTCSLGWTLATL